MVYVVWNGCWVMFTLCEEPHMKGTWFREGVLVVGCFFLSFCEQTIVTIVAV